MLTVDGGEERVVRVTVCMSTRINRRDGDNRLTIDTLPAGRVGRV